MDIEHIKGLVGEFTWDFGQEFFIETSEGNFVWSDPDYNGDNSLTPYAGTYKQWIGRGFGRDKGKSIIALKCGENIWLKAAD